MPLRRLLTAVVVLGCAATALGTSTATVQAAGETVQETGTVTSVVDGDTFDVKIGSATKSVRLLGINAMEVFHPSYAAGTTSNQCHGVTAGDALSSLVYGKTVQLRAISAKSTSDSRLLRSVWVQQGGVWVDVQRILLQDSLALPLPFGNEPTHNLEYLKLAQQVAAGGTGLWDPASCKSGPSQDIPIKVEVNADADGSDSTNINGEWVRVENLDPTQTLSLAGWRLRDGSNKMYTFPKGTTVAPNSRVTVRVGKGTATATTKYWGETSPIFDNTGDGAYLFDPDAVTGQNAKDGDLRAYMMYPCLTACTDPAQGALEISSVSYDPAGTDADNVNGEYVKIKNVSASPVKIGDYLLVNYPYNYSFYYNWVIQPGQTFTVRAGKGTDTATTKYWGKTAPILNNGGDVVQLETYTGIVLSCKAWGTSHC